jgi:hypothetical protein
LLDTLLPGLLNQEQACAQSVGVVGPDDLRKLIAFLANHKMILLRRHIPFWGRPVLKDDGPPRAERLKQADADAIATPDQRRIKRRPLHRKAGEIIGDVNSYAAPPWQFLRKCVCRCIRKAGKKDTPGPRTRGGVGAMNNFGLAIGPLHARPVNDGEICPWLGEHARQPRRKLRIVRKNNSVCERWTSGKHLRWCTNHLP